MNAYTVYQPYAFATVAGLKHYETRPRRTNIRGRVAVHAGAAGFDAAMKGRTREDIDRITEMQHESPFSENVLFRGGVVGTVEIVDCVPVEEIMHTLTERERLLGDFTPGRFAWVLQNPVMFDEPFPARGQQGWWEWDEIEACAARIQKATYQLGLNFFNGVTPGSDYPPADILRKQAAEFLKDLNRAQEIVIDPNGTDIKLGDISLDVLPLLPGAFAEISDRGEYRVFQGGTLIGTIRYKGPSEQDAPGTVNIGAKTEFIPSRPVEHIEIKCDLGDERAVTAHEVKESDFPMQ